ncbi:MAG TPA: MBL fold metallo-hydrolase [Solirubrobacterales bacterium]|jgi:glyoxylase-like metal-dependent hydrolase (beta-lactamase superfamily II)|nr:MBL fold metallo-hydrolase [Solirubrobacterales bacterium]
MTHSVDLLFPDQRFVFDVERGSAALQPAGDSPTGFRAYKELQAAGRRAAMLVIPNSCLIQASRPYIVDPGLAMQGAPYSTAIESYGVNPFLVQDVILTHLHFDHVGGLIEFPGRRAYVHRIELDAPYAGLQKGLLESVDLEILDGDEGEIEPGLRWILTPGHCDGLITLLIDTADGLVAIPSDCVGPLPEYFDEMRLPEDFPQREVLLEQWRKIRSFAPARIVPGHYAPFKLADRPEL